MAYICLVGAILAEIAYAVWFSAGFISFVITDTILYEQIPDRSATQVLG